MQTGGGNPEEEEERLSSGLEELIPYGRALYSKSSIHLKLMFGITGGSEGMCKLVAGWEKWELHTDKSLSEVAVGGRKWGVIRPAMWL